MTTLSFFCILFLARTHNSETITLTLFAHQLRHLIMRHPFTPTITPLRAVPRRVGFLLLVALLAAVAFTPRAHAECWFVDGFDHPISTPATAGQATFGSINIAPGLIGYPAVGQPFPQGSTTAFAGQVPAMDCRGNTQAGLSSVHGTALNAAGTLFPSGIQGVAFQISVDNTPLPDYPHFEFKNNKITTFKLQLIYVGPHPPYLASAAIPDLAQLDVLVCHDPKTNPQNEYTGCNAPPVQTTIIKFSLSALVVNSTGCTVSSGNANVAVQLPQITTRDLSGSAGSTTGKTPFQLYLSNCGSGANVSITITTSTALAGTPGVIENTLGSATGIGVQLLQPDGTSPVPFGTSFAGGTYAGADGDSFDITLYARYYKTQSAPVGAGSVKATATYTLTYQ